MQVLVVRASRAPVRADDGLLTGEGSAADVQVTGMRPWAAMRLGPEDLGRFDAVVIDRVQAHDAQRMVSRLRRIDGAVPLIAIGDDASPAATVSMLDAGADASLTAPILPGELPARLRALHRRSAQRLSRQTLVHDDLAVHPAQQQAFRGSRRLDVTATELTVLAALVERAPGVCTHGHLRRVVWPQRQDVCSSSLVFYISQLRRKTELGDQPRIIHTVRDVGYRLSASSPG